MNSIIDNDKTRCYICGKFGQTEEHHLIPSVAQRKKCVAYGLSIYICRQCHQRIHDTNWMMSELKALAQTMFELTYPEEDFFKIFGRYYK